MNSNGDVFNGNTKTTASSGEVVSYDIPTPTVTGQDASKLSSVFDEVTVKERLLVEGGASGQVLSQFDGPVNFNKDLRIKAQSTFSNTVRLSQGTQSTSTTTGDLIVSGGVGIGKHLYAGGNLIVTGSTTLNSTLNATGATVLGSTLNVTGSTTLGSTLGVTGATNISGATVLGSTLNVTGATTLGSTLGVTGATTLSSTLSVSGSTSVDALNINTSGAPQGDLYTSGGGDGVFNINNTSNSGTTVFNNKNSSGTYNDILTLTSSTALVDGALNVTGDITAFYTSDQRLKDNITPISDALDKVISISGNTFDWNEKSEKEGSDVGVVAQEILEVLPEAVTTRENGYLAVRYEKLVPLLIEAIKDLKTEIDELKKSTNK
jgi:hypothetical protein